jgi:tRNA G10  N-methylase Trm11
VPPVAKKTYGPKQVAHPAVYSSALMPVFAHFLKRYMPPAETLILDPFAGTGRIHELRQASTMFTTVGVEIEPEWAELHPDTICANTLDLPFRDGEFDAIVTSPTYGNRMADHHNAQDGSLRRSYTHDLGRKLHPENAGQLHWGPKYRDFHQAAWTEVVRVLRPKGLFILNCKDHIRAGKRQYVCRWHLATLRSLGVTRIESLQVGTPSMRAGANGDLRLTEMVYALRKN